MYIKVELLALFYVAYRRREPHDLKYGCHDFAVFDTRLEFLLRPRARVKRWCLCGELPRSTTAANEFAKAQLALRISQGSGSQVIVSVPIRDVLRCFPPGLYQYLQDPRIIRVRESKL